MKKKESVVWNGVPLPVERFQKSLLAVCVVVLVSVLLGKFVLAPLAKYIPDTLMYFLAGLSVLAIGAYLYRMCLSVRYDIKLTAMMLMNYPESVQEYKAKGVVTPVDFAYLTIIMTEYEHMPLFGSGMNEQRISSNHLVLDKSYKLFREMFGREPEAGVSRNWLMILVYEIAAQEGLEVDKISIGYLEDMDRFLSPSVRDYLKRQHAEQLPPPVNDAA